MKTYLIETKKFNLNKQLLDGFVFHRQYNETHIEVQIACYSKHIKPFIEKLITKNHENI